MRSLFWAGICGCGWLVCSGCNWNAGAQTKSEEQPAAGSVLVVNLQDVLERLGRDKDLNQQLQARREEHQQELSEQSKTLEKQFTDKKASFGENPTEEQQKELQSLRLQLTLQLRQLQNQFNTEFTAYRQQLVNRFREEVKPVASAVAKKRNASVVLARDDGVVLVYENAVDITDDVVQGMLAATPVGGASEAPTANEKKTE